MPGLGVGSEMRLPVCRSETNDISSSSSISSIFIINRRRRCLIIRSPSEKFPPADSLPVICRVRLFWGRSYNGETFYRAGDILISGRHINSVIIFPRTDFSWGRHFNVTPALSPRLRFTSRKKETVCRRDCYRPAVRFDNSNFRVAYCLL